MNGRRCEEKVHLLFQYRNSANQYLARIALMSELAGDGVTKVEFAWLSEATSEAHEKCVEARERLFKHTKEHGC